MKCQKCGKETDTLYMTRFGDYCEDCVMEKYDKGELDKMFVKTEGTQKEAVNHPLHYGGDTPYECIKVLRSWLSEEEYRGFCRGNALKYLCRVGKKDEAVQELKKARFYLDKLIESFS